MAEAVARGGGGVHHCPRATKVHEWAPKLGLQTVAPRVKTIVDYVNYL